jgi:hypothetical protein
MTCSCPLSNFQRLPSSHLSVFTVGLPADAQLSLVFAEPPRQFYRDPKLTAVNRDLSIYRDYPIWTALHGPKSFHPSTGIRPFRQFCLDNETFSHLPGLYLDPKLSSVYRDYAKTHASAGRGRQLIKPPGRCKQAG